ncbi:hypothetical protein [Cupriavidus metallidurans]|uniref:hypothetical protein n=1 Tax=Cupriavidus metallidurans TaxID=119219 RepID=UPI003CFF4524
MPNNTTQVGQVGEPTPMKIANELDHYKATATPLYFDLQCDRGDDFDDMGRQGLPCTAVIRLRRIAHGLDGIREIAKVLSVFDTERLAQENGGTGMVLSPRSQEGILRGAEVLADLLSQEVYALGADLTHPSQGASQ